MFKSFSMLAVAACAGISIASCTADKDLYDPTVVEQDVIADYESNFIKKFGSSINISDQNWDLAEDYTAHLQSAFASTRAVFGEGFNPSISAWETKYDVLPETIEWLDDNLPEKVNNKEKAQPFFLESWENTFNIVPIYIGQASYFWKLHLVITDDNGDEKDFTVWEKGDGVEILDNDSWKTLGKGEFETTIGKTVKSKQFEVLGCPKGTKMSFYLEIFNERGFKLPSSFEVENSIAAISCPTPSNLEPVDGVERGCIILGCEDRYDKFTDWDMNDIVFMIYGNPIPPVKPEVEKYYQRANKRYLVEDLGATNDFDFNDVVVDVTAEREVTLTKIQGKVVDAEYGDWKNAKAKVRALGGTIDISMKIGNTEWKKTGNVSEMINTKNPDYSKVLAEFDVEGWNPKENNIEVEARSMKNDQVFTRKVKFPKKGEVPMIIAVKPSQNWMVEYQSIPSDWFTVE